MQISRQTGRLRTLLGDFLLLWVDSVPDLIPVVRAPQFTRHPPAKPGGARSIPCFGPPDSVFLEGESVWDMGTCRQGMFSAPGDIYDIL